MRKLSFLLLISTLIFIALVFSIALMKQDFAEREQFDDSQDVMFLDFSSVGVGRQLYTIDELVPGVQYAVVEFSDDRKTLTITKIIRLEEQPDINMSTASLPTWK